MSSFAITWSPIVFGFALFLGSALLFLVQPMLGRTMEPLLGGNPLAWKACLVFFQATLLAGYCYANLLHRFRGLRWQPWLQIALMALAALLCFVGFFGDRLLFQLAPRLDSLERWPIVSTLCLLIVVIGVPFFALSAVGPLAHRWFAHLDHPKASDPYYLFVASNLGGLAGLIVYVLLIEPNAPLRAQWLSWKLAFTALTVMVGIVALCAWRSPRNPELEPATPSDPDAPPVVQLIGRGPATWPRRWYWFAAAALPVAMLMGLTDYLTLDLAPAPILWAIPIAAYLFAFSQAFSRFTIFNKGSFVVRLIVQLLYGACLCGAAACLIVSLVNFDHPGDPAKGTLTTICVITFGMILLVPSSWVYFLQPFSALVIVFLQANVFKLADVFVPTVLLYLACYYLSVRLCLTLLAKDRPVAAAVTTYYSWIGLGGLAGGLFQLLIAPLVFRTDYLEFAFAAALACTLRPAWTTQGWTDWLASLPFARKQDAQPPATSRLARAFDLALPLGMTMLAALLFLLRSNLAEFIVRPNENLVATGLRHLLIDLPLVLATIAASLLIARPIRFGLALAGLVAVCWIGQHHDPHEMLLVRQRSAFGIIKVGEQQKPFTLDHQRRMYIERALMQGTMLQGNCITEPPELRRHPTAYYHRKGPVGQVLRNLEWFSFPKDKPPPGFWLKENRDNARDDARIAASIIGMAAAGGVEPIGAAWSEPPFAFVGLGAGSLFTYAHPYQWVDAYELDPAINALSAGEQPIFHYLHSAQERGVAATLHTGDGRRLLAKPGHEAFYHVLFVDAFNSNAIPTHLLTKQAIETYFFKLVPDGVVCIHTSNRNLELAKVLDQISRRLDIAIRVLHAEVNDNDAPTLLGSEWVVLARNQEVMQKWDKTGGFVHKAQGVGIRRNRGFPGFFEENRLAWTDDRASLFSAMRPGQPMPAFVYGVLGMLLGFAVIMAIIEMIANRAAPAAPGRTPVRGVR